MSRQGRHGMEWLGMEGQGGMWRGWAWQSRQGTAGLGGVWQGKFRLGMAVRARRGRAR